MVRGMKGRTRAESADISQKLDKEERDTVSRGGCRSRVEPPEA